MANNYFGQFQVNQGPSCSFNNSLWFLAISVTFLALTVGGGYLSNPSKLSGIYLEEGFHSLASHWSSEHGLLPNHTIKLGAEYLTLTKLFLYLATLNLVGMAENTWCPNTFFSYTISLTVSIWIFVVIYTMYTHYQSSGNEALLGGFLMNLLPAGSPLPLSLVLVPVELVSHLISPLALGLRLAMNLTAGHVLLSVVMGYVLKTSGLVFLFAAGILCFTPCVLALMVLLVLEVAVCLIQAYVFTLLVSMYLKESAEVH